jgi:hypothetical protein
VKIVSKGYKRKSKLSGSQERMLTPPKGVPLIENIDPEFLKALLLHELL